MILFDVKTFVSTFNTFEVHIQNRIIHQFYEKYTYIFDSMSPHEIQFTQNVTSQRQSIRTLCALQSLLKSLLFILK